MPKLTLATLAALALLGAAHTVAAQPAADTADTVSIRVPLGDLNLTSQDGAAVALRRIGSAAADICGQAPAAVELDRAMQYRTCLSGIVDHAVADLGASMVTALASGQQDRPSLVAANR